MMRPNGILSGDVNGQTSSESHLYPSAPIAVNPETTSGLKQTKKGGILGKKRGKYKKDSRVTQWRHRAKAAKLEAQLAATTLPTRFRVAVSPQDEHRSPSTGCSSAEDDLGVEAPSHDCLPVEDLIAKLTSELSEVKSSRTYQYSAYDTLRRLSVLRFFEQTSRRHRSEQDVAAQLAELLWVHKPSMTRKSDNSIRDTSLLIRGWAKEYRTTGKLREHAFGTPASIPSKLSRSDIASEAQKELKRMARPSANVLRDLLLTRIFPKFGVNEPYLTEHTCSKYMKKWGWGAGEYRQWIPKNQKPLRAGSSESDEGNTASEETSVMEARPASIQHMSPTVKPPAWNAPIPSPTTALTSSPTKPAILSHVSEVFGGIPSNSAVNTVASTAFTSDSTMDIPMLSHYNGYTPSHLEFQQSGYINYPMDPSQIYNMPLTPASLDSSQFSVPQRSAYHEQANRSYLYKTLDHLVPDPPEMMGHRPTFNGIPATTFVPPPEVVAQLSHDNSFPSQIRRRSSGGRQTILPEHNQSTLHQFTPHSS